MQHRWVCIILGNFAAFSERSTPVFGSSLLAHMQRLRHGPWHHWAYRWLGIEGGWDQSQIHLEAQPSTEPKAEGWQHPSPQRKLPLQDQQCRWTSWTHPPMIPPAATFCEHLGYGAWIDSACHAEAALYESSSCQMHLVFPKRLGQFPACLPGSHFEARPHPKTLGSGSWTVSAAGKEFLAEWIHKHWSSLKRQEMLAPWLLTRIFSLQLMSHAAAWQWRRSQSQHLPECAVGKKKTKIQARLTKWLG